MIRNLLVEVAKKIFQSLKGKKWGKKFMMMGDFLQMINEYKNGKYSFLFSDIDVDLRNSFVHSNIDFLNDEIGYFDSRGVKKTLKQEDFLSKYKKLAALYATLFSYRTKVFLDEMKRTAKKMGFL